jgi:hypothetical protein
VPSFEGFENRNLEFSYRSDEEPANALLKELRYYPTALPVSSEVDLDKGDDDGDAGAKGPDNGSIRTYYQLVFM